MLTLTLVLCVLPWVLYRILPAHFKLVQLLMAAVILMYRNYLVVWDTCIYKNACQMEACCFYQRFYMDKWQGTKIVLEICRWNIFREKFNMHLCIVLTHIMIITKGLIFFQAIVYYTPWLVNIYTLLSWRVGRLILLWLYIIPQEIAWFTTQISV